MKRKLCLCILYQPIILKLCEARSSWSLSKAVSWTQHEFKSLWSAAVLYVSYSHCLGSNFRKWCKHITTKTFRNPINQVFKLEINKTSKRWVHRSLRKLFHTLVVKSLVEHVQVSTQNQFLVASLGCNRVWLKTYDIYIYGYCCPVI